MGRLPVVRTRQSQFASTLCFPRRLKDMSRKKCEEHTQNRSRPSDHARTRGQFRAPTGRSASMFLRRFLGVQFPGSPCLRIVSSPCVREKGNDCQNSGRSFERVSPFSVTPACSSSFFPLGPAHFAVHCSHRPNCTFPLVRRNRQSRSH